MLVMSLTINWTQPIKSEAMILGSRQSLSRLEPVASLDIGDGHVEVRDEIKILGVHMDPTLSMSAQVKSLIKTSNFHIRALRHVRRGLTLESVKKIALGLVTSRLDYCNSLLYGTSKANIGRLQPEASFGGAGGSVAPPRKKKKEKKKEKKKKREKKRKIEKKEKRELYWITSNYYI